MKSINNYILSGNLKILENFNGLYDPKIFNSIIILMLLLIIILITSLLFITKE